MNSFAGTELRSGFSNCYVTILVDGCTGDALNRLRRVRGALEFPTRGRSSRRKAAHSNGTIVRCDPPIGISRTRRSRETPQHPWLRRGLIRSIPHPTRNRLH